MDYFVFDGGGGVGHGGAPPANAVMDALAHLEVNAHGYSDSAERAWEVVWERAGDDLPMPNSLGSPGPLWSAG